MSCIVYTFATAPDLDPLPDAAPWPVLARQLPRQLVVCLNGEADRGARFVPLIGVMDGRRRFLEPVGPMPREFLQRIAVEGSTGFVVAGELDADRLVVHVYEKPGFGERLELALTFDPREPWSAMRRAAFEIGEAFGVRDPRHGAPPLGGFALARWFEARDALLGLEAKLVGVDARRAIEAVRVALEAAPAVREVQEVFRDVVRQVARNGLLDTQAAREIETALYATAAPLELVADAARHVEGSLGPGTAGDLWQRVALGSIDDAGTLAEASSSLFTAGRVELVRDLLRSAVERGCRDPNLRAQLAAVEDVGGDPLRRDHLLGELWNESAKGLPPRVARLVASWLVDRDHAAEALALIERSSDSGTAVPGIWLERGRALVALGRVDDAQEALERSLALGPSPEAGAECRRLLALCATGELVPMLLSIERLLHAGDRAMALDHARRLVRRHGRVPEAWVMLGVTRHAIGHRRRALRAFRRALALDPRSADAHGRIGASLVERGRPEEGLTHLRHAVELSPHDPGNWLHLAMALAMLGRRDEALAAVSRAEKEGATAEEVSRATHAIGPSLGSSSLDGAE
ncbi:MAG: tetratricopeptide repeat protein [Planctomycetes bacterium]|nr:tetratricopeptide repeat protein [Planctomycetota bacterium]